MGEDAALLKGWLRRRWPRASSETIELESDCHPHTLAFWLGLGFWPGLFSGHVARPDGKHRERARKLLRSYRMPGQFELTLDDLPSKFRIFFVDGHDTRFVILDEDDRDRAPLVRMIEGDTARVVPAGDAYPTIARDVFEAGMEGWVKIRLRSLNGHPVVLTGKRPFPALAPQMVELAPDVWADTKDACSVLVRCPSFAGLLEWLPECPRGLKLDTVPLGRCGVTTIDVPGTPEKALAHLSSAVVCGADAREVAWRFEQYALAERTAPVPPTIWRGEIAQHQVLLRAKLEYEKLEVHVLCSKEDAAEVKGEVAAFSHPA